MRTSQRAYVVLAVLLAATLAACGGGASSIQAGFPADAKHPAPVTKTFNGCPPGGDGGDSALNKLKNRVDDGENGTYHDIAFATYLGLTWPKTIEVTKRANWSSADTDFVNQYEGVALRLTGTIVDVKHEGTESTNCHSVDDRDFHIFLVSAPSDPKSKSVVIEITPRMRALRPGWTDSALFALKGQQVRISGWSMLDQEHPDQVGNTRGTIWEIHPITHIEISSGYGWRSIDG